MENAPGWVTYAVGVASIVFIVLGGVLIMISLAVGKQLIGMMTRLEETAKEIKDSVQQEFRKEMLPEITGTLKNVRIISDDARANAKTVTITYGADA